MIKTQKKFKMLTREVSRTIPGGIGFGASRLRLPPPGASSSAMPREHRFAISARHHLRCPGSIASRWFDRFAIFDNIASRCFGRFAMLAMLRSLRDLRSIATRSWIAQL